MLWKEETLDEGVIRLRATIDEDMTKPLRKISRSFEHESVAAAVASPSQLFYLGHAFHTLTQLQNIAPVIYLITNDVSESEASVFDDTVLGSIPEIAFEKHRFKAVPSGFSENGSFKKDLDFDNHIFQLRDGDFIDFIHGFLGQLMNQIVYWFAFAPQETRISDIERAMTTSSNEDELAVSLCRSCKLLVEGFEMDSYVFTTKDSKLATNLVRSFKQ